MRSPLESVRGFDGLVVAGQMRGRRDRRIESAEELVRGNK